MGSRRSVWRLAFGVRRLAFGVRGDLPVRRSPTSCRVVGLLSWDEVGSLYAERSTLRKTLSGATDVPNQETQSPSVIRHLSFVICHLSFVICHGFGLARHPEHAALRADPDFGGSL